MPGLTELLHLILRVLLVCGHMLRVPKYASHGVVSGHLLWRWWNVGVISYVIYVRQSGPSPPPPPKRNTNRVTTMPPPSRASHPRRPSLPHPRHPKRGLGVNSEHPTSDDEYSPLGHSTTNTTTGGATTLRHHSSTANANVTGDGGAGSVRSAFTFPSAFGEVSMSGDTSQLTDGVGTGPYIAPEQGARFGQYNHKADMWSLGVILFEARYLEGCWGGRLMLTNRSLVRFEARDLGRFVGCRMVDGSNLG